MREMYREIARRLRADERCVVATLVEARHARPAPIGTSLVVGADGSFVGNIGAGCHEPEMIEAARAMLAAGGRRRMTAALEDEIFDGSACGASLTVELWIPDASFLAIADRIVEGQQPVSFTCGVSTCCIEAKRSLVVVGATQLAAQLTRSASSADFLTTIVDPRAEFATKARHPQADRIVVAWPQDVLPEMLSGADALVVLAHDAKIELPALACGLTSEIRYIGVLGSRRAHRARERSLVRLGYSPGALSRIHGPVGLDLGGLQEAQIACSILAEMLAVLNHRNARPLCEAEAPLRS